MKTLYISDLDGTLLTPDACLSPRTRRAISAFTASGGFFTVATARTRETARFILDGSGINIPAVLMNGVAVWDADKDKYVSVNYIRPDTVSALIRTVTKYKLSGFLYRLRGTPNGSGIPGADSLDVLHTALHTDASVCFRKERVVKYGKRFTEVDSLEAYTNGIIYYSASDRKEILDSAADELSRLPGLNVIYHADVYNTGMYYLDVCAADASKSSGLMFLRELYGFDRIAAFGDNYNDFPLFGASDYKYAVANAVPELAAIADRVIGSNRDDGVAEFLESIT